MIYDGFMDKECIQLCDALNALPGIETFESCCGHGKQPYRIWFTARFTRDLCVPTMSCNRNYCGHLGWHIEVDHVESPSNRAVFLLEGPIGKDAYASIADIVKTMKEFEYERTRK